MPHSRCGYKGAGEQGNYTKKPRAILSVRYIYDFWTLRVIKGKFFCSVLDCYLGGEN